MCAEEKKIVSQLSTLFKNLKWVMVAFGIITFALGRRPLSYVFLGIACVLFCQFLWRMDWSKIWRILSMLLVTMLVAGWIGMNVREDIRKAQGLLFSPAKSDELLIIVAQFEGSGLNPTIRIVNRLQEELEKADIKNTRIKTVPETGPKISNKEAARKIGKIHNAVFVIWGWYDDAGFSPNFTIIKESKRPLTVAELKEIPSELKEFNLYIREGLPGYMSYFATSTIGQLYYWNSEYDKAFSAFNVAVEILERSPRIKGIQVPGGLNSSYFFRGKANYKNSNLDQAIDDFSKAIELDPRYADAYYNRGFAYGKKENLDQAIDDFSKAIELDPRYDDAYYNRGVAYGKKENLDQAIADYSKAIELDPRYADAYWGRGYAYSLGGLKDQAVYDFEMYLRLHPNASNRSQVERWIKELKE